MLNMSSVRFPTLHDTGVKLVRTKDGKLARAVPKSIPRPIVQISDADMAFKVLAAHSIGDRSDPVWIAPGRSKTNYLKLRKTDASRKAALRASQSCRIHTSTSPPPRSRKRRVPTEHLPNPTELQRANDNDPRRAKPSKPSSSEGRRKYALLKAQESEDEDIQAMQCRIRRMSEQLSEDLGSFQDAENRLRHTLHEKGERTLLEIRKRSRMKAAKQLGHLVGVATRRIFFSGGWMAFLQKSDRWQELEGIKEIAHGIFRHCIENLPSEEEHEEADSAESADDGAELVRTKSGELLTRIGRGMLGRMKGRNEARETLKGALKELGNGRLSRIPGLAHCSNFERNRLALVLAIATGERGQNTLSAVLNAITFVERMHKKISRARERSKKDWTLTQKRRQGWKSHAEQVEARRELATKQDAFFEMLASQVQKEVRQRTRHLAAL